MPKKAHVQLSASDLQHFKSLVKKGQLPARHATRILALLELDRGQTYEQVAQTTHLTYPSLRRLARSYPQCGRDCIYDKPRSGRPVKIDAALADRITTLACEQAPEGYARWSLRLLADKVVELDYCEQISHTSVANVLGKKN